MAAKVVRKYPLKNDKLTFIQHGENATFKIHSADKQYLVRLHRDGYHSKSALLEELNWLKHIADSTDVSVQRPLQSKQGNYVELQDGEQMPSRYCSVLEWQVGKKSRSNLSDKDFFKVGELTAKLHRAASKIEVKQRRYWTSEGLVGKDAKLGSLLAVKAMLSPNDYSIMEACRDLVCTKLQQYQDRNPRKLSLIHADLHFGNMLWNDGKVLPIDFDDCGYGFHLYDLAVTIFSSLGFDSDEEIKTKKKHHNALLEGYRSIATFIDEDHQLLPYFVVARRLALFGWLYHRRDNPRLFDYFRDTISKNIDEFRRVLECGPDPVC